MCTDKINAKLKNVSEARSMLMYGSILYPDCGCDDTVTISYDPDSADGYPYRLRTSFGGVVTNEPVKGLWDYVHEWCVKREN